MWKRWMELAEADLDSAKSVFSVDRYYVVVFLCEQAVEKGLKALAIRKGLGLIKTHDLVILAKSVGLSEEYFLKLDELFECYIKTRYIIEICRETFFDEKLAKKFIKLSEDVILWIKKKV